MESVGLLLGGVPDRGRVDPFGFSWSLAVWLRNPREMTVGFPWISFDFSSEFRLINGLHGGLS